MLCAPHIEVELGEVGPVRESRCVRLGLVLGREKLPSSHSGTLSSSPERMLEDSPCGTYQGSNGYLVGQSVRKASDKAFGTALEAFFVNSAVLGVGIG